MMVFSFGLVPAQAFRASRFRGGATDPINGKSIRITIKVFIRESSSFQELGFIPQVCPAESPPASAQSRMDVLARSMVCANAREIARFGEAIARIL